VLDQNTAADTDQAQAAGHDGLPMEKLAKQPPERQARRRSHKRACPVDRNNRLTGIL